MRLLGTLLLGGALGLVATASEAADAPSFSTTADLVRMCTAAGDAVADDKALAFCDGFIAGTGSLYLELVRTETIRPWACAQRTPTLAEARTAFVSWAAANPQHLQDRPVDGFWRAMAATYPCPK